MVAIFVRTLIVYVLLSISMKMMGKREIGELDVSELVSTLLISEIAAIPIDDPDLPLFNAVIPVLFILSLEIILSYAKTRCARLKKYVEGEPAYIIKSGTLIQSAFLENRISINEFLAEMRAQGIGDINDIEDALLEQSGKISILKKSKNEIPTVLIMDGEYNEPMLEGDNISREFVDKALKKRGLTVDEVFYMDFKEGGSFNIILKEEK